MDQSAFIIRAAGIDDAPVLVDFNARLAEETEHLRLDPATLEAGVRAGLLDSTKSRYFVAEIAGRVVGQLMLTVEWSDWRNGEIWWVQSVYVHADFRRRGVFRSLYRHIESLARAGGAVGIRLYVIAENHAARDTYQNLGMDVSEYIVMENLRLRGDYTSGAESNQPHDSHDPVPPR